MTSATKTTAQLVLASGSRAGLVATIHLGFYMIGRSKECQIRPKSRSVSRRHCIMRWEDDLFRVFDLDSTSGTRVNGDKITPRTWVELSDGDELRCGKIAFTLQLRSLLDTETAHPAERLPSEAVIEESSMVRGSAWQESDIADFLASADDADREKRYDSIRSKNSRDAEDSGIFGDDVVDVETGSDLGSGSLDSDLQAARSSRAFLAGSLDDGPSTIIDEPSSNNNPTQNEKKQSEVKTKKAAQRLPPEHRQKSTPLAARDFDQIKLIAVTIVTVLVLGLAVYQVAKLVSGPAPQIIQGID